MKLLADSGRRVRGGYLRRSFLGTVSPGNTPIRPETLRLRDFIARQFRAYRSHVAPEQFPRRPKAARVEVTRVFSSMVSILGPPGGIIKSFAAGHVAKNTSAPWKVCGTDVHRGLRQPGEAHLAMIANRYEARTLRVGKKNGTDGGVGDFKRRKSGTR